MTRKANPIDENTDAFVHIAATIPKELKQRILDHIAENEINFNGPCSCSKVIEVALSQYFQDLDEMSEYNDTYGGSFKLPGE